MNKIIFTKHLKKNIGFVMILFFSFNLVNGQHLSLTGSVGGSNYLGDLATGYTPAFKPSISLGATYDVTNRYRFRVNLSSMSIEGDDSKSPKAGIKGRNLNFKSNIQEAALLGEYDLVDNSFNSIIPYLFGGFSVYHFDPHPLRPIDSLGDVDLHSLGTEGQYLPSFDSKGNIVYKYADRQYNLNQVNLQLGGGVRFEISERVSIAVEANYRKLFTDYLDDVSTNSYISNQDWQTGIGIAKNQLKDAALAKRLQLAEDYSWRYIDNKGNARLIPQKPTSDGVLYPRGNPANNDAYYSFQIRVNIRLNALRSGDDLYSPRNPNGRGQLKCAKRVF